MAIQYHSNIVQGSEEWKAIRCGKLTASKISKLITPTLRIADNDDSRMIVFEIMQERITNRSEDEFQSWDMMRGNEEELYARALYNETYAPVQEMGFVTNDRWGFELGWSPDGLVGDDGAIECKSRANKHQIKAILGGELPKEHVIQVQASLFVSERSWVDYNSYSNGLVMWTKRVEPIPEIQNAIYDAVHVFEDAVLAKTKEWMEIINSDARIVPTQYREYNQEISV